MKVGDAIGYAKSRSPSHRAVIRVHDDAGNVVEAHEHAGDFKERERTEKSRHAVDSLAEPYLRKALPFPEILAR